MRRTVELAEQVRGQTGDNPWVGCVIVKDGEVLGEGHTHPPGEDHAEAAAIQRAFSVKRQLVLDRARGMGLGLHATPAGSFYAFVALDNLPAGLQDGMAFFRAALERQVIVVPGEFFDVNPGQRRDHIPSRLKRFVRLSFGPSMDTVRTGLERLDQLIRDA